MGLYLKFIFSSPLGLLLSKQSILFLHVSILRPLWSTFLKLGEAKPTEFPPFLLQEYTGSVSPCSIHFFTNTTFQTEAKRSHVSNSSGLWSWAHLFILCMGPFASLFATSIIGSHFWGQGTQSSDLLSLHCCKREAGFPSLPACKVATHR